MHGTLQEQCGSSQIWNQIVRNFRHREKNQKIKKRFRVEDLILKKVFYYCNFPSPYYIGFLNEIGKYCELTAVFERGDSSERDSSWKNFSAPNIKNLIIMHGIHTKADMAFCPQIIKYIKIMFYKKIIVIHCLLLKLNFIFQLK